MEVHKNLNCIRAESEEDWRKWLEKNYDSDQSVWLIIYKKDSKVASVYYSEAVDQALCFGWIDSVPNKRDAESYYVLFSKRNPKSNWSQVNKNKIARLEKLGLIHESGRRMIELAKESGTWNALEKVDALEEPEDLMNLLNASPTALANWQTLSKSYRRGVLEWLQGAKKSETRSKRLIQIVERLEEKKRII
ncbi:MAG: YdeI/OmpD-associated family protein [Flavobacteriales bacterium]|jgi:uncharacterized protein YdeI (YjbR/CyaY-like superfamily)